MTCSPALLWRIGPILLKSCGFHLHLIDLLNILLKYNGFTGIQKAVVDLIGSRPPNSDMTFFGTSLSLALGSTLELLLSPITELVIAGGRI